MELEPSPQLLEQPDSEARRANRAQATEYLTHILALRGNPHFDWFCKNCIAKITKETERELKSAQSIGDKLSEAKQQWLIATQFNIWLDATELVSRETLDADDPALEALRISISEKSGI